MVSRVTLLSLVVLGCGRSQFDLVPDGMPDAGCADLRCGLPDNGNGGDLCTDAITLAFTQLTPNMLAAYASGDTSSATANTASTCGGTAAPEVFYRIDVPAVSTVEITVHPLGNFFDTIWFLRGGPGEDCGTLSTTLACANANGPGTDETQRIDNVVPASYILAVDGIDNASAPADRGLYELVVRVTRP